MEEQKEEKGLLTMYQYDDILNSRICDLKLNLKKSYIQPRINRLYKELRAKNIRFYPECYFADEWFVPEGDPVIGIPFYLATKKLTQLEKKMMGEAEGDNLNYFMKLLRHEVGHAISYAYKLYRKRSYKKIFGETSQLFTDYYKFNKRSKRFVHNLDDHYAQSHPDEDFAETFAVWLTYPEHQWRKIYHRWPALDKLLYVDELMTSIVGTSPKKKKGEKMCHVSQLKYTVWSYYQRRRSLLATHTLEKRH